MEQERYTDVPSRENFFSNSDEKLPPDWVTNILKKYFPNEFVSVGSIVRKIPYLLTDLVSYSLFAWNVTITYDNQNERFLTQLTCPIRKIKLTFFHNISDGVKYENTIDLLNINFTKDKWIPVPIIYAKFLLSTKYGKFIFEKSYPEGDYKRIYSWKCKLSKRSFKTPIYKIIKLFFKRKYELSEIKRFVVLEDILVNARK